MAASLQNDTAQSDYTDNAVLPYVNMAMNELQELFEQNNSEHFIYIVNNGNIEKHG